MINKTSITNREIYPLETFPAECLDYCLVWGNGGMAIAFPVLGKSFHGVIHKIKSSEMILLDKIESTYKRMTARAKKCDGTIINCTV